MPIVAKRNDRFLTRDSPTTSAETLNRLPAHPSNNDIVDPPENIKKGGKKQNIEPWHESILDCTYVIIIYTQEFDQITF
jgi:hypothetical protein